MIELKSIEDSKAWCDAWCCALSVGASVESAEISATLSQYAFREQQEQAA